MHVRTYVGTQLHSQSGPALRSCMLRSHTHPEWSTCLSRSGCPKQEPVGKSILHINFTHIIIICKNGTITSWEMSSLLFMASIIHT